MSDQGKIWFIYLTDHHEGPFSVAEVAEKARQGMVNGQTLAWKDGMAEWVPAETIPDLAPAFAPAGAAAAAPPAGGDGEVSLAQLLASQQSQGTDSVAIDASSPSISAGGGSAISSLMNSIPAAAAPQAVEEGEPGPDDEVWTLKVGNQVNGLYSINRLKQIAAEGEIPADAMLWHAGWSDFRLVNTVPAVHSARRAKPAGATRTGLRATAAPVGARPGGIMAITSAADVGNDEPTDPSIPAPAKGGFLGKLKAMFAKKPKAAAAPRTGAVMIGAGKKKAGPGLGATIKKVVMIVAVVVVLGGGGAAYYLFFSSPIPSNLDVIPEDKENLQLLVKEPIADGKKFAIAQARGTEDNPADDTNPTFYVGSNMPEGSQLTLKLTGKPGTLVNKINFEKSFSATLAKTHLATFELKDDGKPIPMGEYTMKISAAGAEPYEVNRFLGGKKGAVYDRRLKQYREKLEKEYTEEVEEIRELVSTLRNLQGEVGKRLADFKANGTNPANKARMAADWRSFVPTFETMASQLATKLKARLDAPDQRYYLRAYQDISSTLDQLRSVVDAHGQRLAGQPPKENPEEKEALVQAGIQSLDQVVAQAVIKTPFDAPKGAAPAAAAPAASPAAPAPVK